MAPKLKVKKSSFYKDISINNDGGTAVGFVASTDEHLKNWLEDNYVDPSMLDEIQGRHKRFAALDAIDVAEASRGQGHGTDLLEQFEDKTEGRGATVILLIGGAYDTVQSQGFDLLRWYESHGYEEVSDARSVGTPLMAKGL